MFNKIKNMSKYLFYIIISNIIYGVILYSFVTWLLEYSEIYAYLGNLVLIFIGLWMDKLIFTRIFQSKKLADELIKVKDLKKRTLTDRMIRWQLQYFVSYKTSLFFFYIFVLIFSQILKYKPDLASAQFTSFINLIDYSVIILLAFKDFGEEFSKDRDRMKATLEEYDEHYKKNI